MLKIAHRGASGHAPENTLLAFEKAMALGADMIELDVRRCGSGELVVIHDPHLLRAYGLPGFVKHKTLLELKRLTGRRGRPILTLTEALQALQGRAALDIELKERGSASQVLPIIKNCLGQNLAWDKFLISSFRHQELEIARRLSAEVKLGILYPGWPIGYQKFAHSIRATAIITHPLFTNRSLVKQAQKLGLQIYIWTVNSRRQIAKFKNWGVDGIISNYPERL